MCSHQNSFEKLFRIVQLAAPKICQTFFSGKKVARRKNGRPRPLLYLLTFVGYLYLLYNHLQSIEIEISSKISYWHFVWFSLHRKLFPFSPAGRPLNFKSPSLLPRHPLQLLISMWNLSFHNFQWWFTLFCQRDSPRTKTCHSPGKRADPSPENGPLVSKKSSPPDISQNCHFRHLWLLVSQN